MKNKKYWICLFIIAALLVSLLQAPVFADTGNDNVKIYIVAAGVGALVAVCMSANTIITNINAGHAYKEGETFAAQGKWDLAVEAYTKAAAIKPNYKDVQAKIVNAKEQAALMFAKQGDEANVKEQYEEAIALYQKGLQYQPDSIEIKTKMDGVAQVLVPVYYNRGFAFEVQNRWEEAFNEYKKAYLINPEYQDIAERYNIAKTKLNGKLTTLAILFFVNHSAEPGLENSLAQSLQKEMEAQSANKYVMLDYQKVQAIITEQAAGLGNSMNDDLAMDLGRILNANEVLLGDILTVSKSGKAKIEVSLRILKVPGKELVKEIKSFTYTFKKKTAQNLALAMPELAKELARKLK